MHKKCFLIKIFFMRRGLFMKKQKLITLSILILNVIIPLVIHGGG